MHISSLFRRSFVTGLALGAVLAIPSGLTAQDLTAPTAPRTTEVVATPQPASLLLAGPRPVQAGVTQLALTEPAPMAEMLGPSRRNTAWMVVGGATLVVGSVVGGDAGTIMMVTGGVIGLMGLWRYLQ